MTQPPPQQAVTAPEQFGKWTIWYQPWPIECRDYDWHFAHKNVRVAEELSGHCESREMCLQAIDWLEECERERETEEGKAKTQAFVDSGMRTLNRALLASSLKSVLDALSAAGSTDLLTVETVSNAEYALDQYEEQTGGARAASLVLDEGEKGQ